ncbi:MAG: toxin TcdB middle/N-terminal domain-containing protein, partial [Bacteroidota bacterium]
QLTFTANINGDPMSDFYYAGTNDNSQYLSVYNIIASNDSTLQVTDTLETSLSMNDRHLFTADINGDNLTDLIHTFLINDDTIAIIPLTGTGVGLVDLNISTRFNDPLATILPADVNGDHFTDLMLFSADTDGNAQITPYLSTGSCFTVGDVFSPGTESQNNLDIIPADINGDAKADLITLELSSGSTVAVSALPSLNIFPDLINQIDNGTGGTYQVCYGPLTDSTLYTISETTSQSQPGMAFFNSSTGARFPAGSNNTTYASGSSNGISNGTFPVQEVDIPIYVVSNYSQSSQVGDYYAYGLQYRNAMVDRNGRGWLGFEQKTLIDSTENSYSKTLYIQDFPGTGTVDTSAVFKLTSDEIMIQKRFQYNDSTAITAEGFTVHHLEKSSSRTDYYHQGDWAYTLGNNYGYDPYGNVELIENLNDTTGNNAVYSLHRFINDTVDWRIGYLSAVQKSSKKTGTDTLSLTLYQYDDEMNLTKKQDWDNAQQAFVNNWFGYDGYGNLTSHVSTSQDTTFFAFDRTYQTFNTEKKSPLLKNSNGNTYRLQYNYDFDPRFGVLKSYQNPNHQTWQFQLDNFGRDTLMLGPDPSNPNNPPVQIRSYSRDFDSKGHFYLESSELLSWDSAYYQTTRSLTDGLGRIFKKQMISGSKTISTDFQYDNKNRIVAKSLPYENDQKLLMTTLYDQLGRVSQKTFPFLNGDSIVHSIDYNENAKKKTIYLAADTDEADTLYLYYDYFQSQEQVIRVVDELGGTTLHQRDLLGRDTLVTDPAQLQNKISISTLHRAMNTNDQSFNNTQYLYVDSLRMRQVISQTQDTVLFTYDPLNRISKIR